MYSPSCMYSRYTKNDTPSVSAPEFIAIPKGQNRIPERFRIIGMEGNPGKIFGLK